MFLFDFKDWITLAVIFLSSLAGVLLPETGRVFQPYPVHALMGVIFLSFLSLSVVEIWTAAGSSILSICRLLAFKMIVIPAAVYLVFRAVLPDYAASALLLSGISSAVSSPFFAGLLRGDVSLSIILVVGSSVLVPFTLPALVHLLVGHTLEISLLAMTRLLCIMIFIPIIVVEALRKLAPKALIMIGKVKFAATLSLFAVMNLGIFSKYADFFYRQYSILPFALAVSTLLAAVFFFSGIFISRNEPPAGRITVIVSLGFMNNVMSMILGSEFFTPLEPTVAAIYTLPQLGLIVALKAYHRTISRAG